MVQAAGGLAGGAARDAAGGQAGAAVAPVDPGRCLAGGRQPAAVRAVASATARFRRRRRALAGGYRGGGLQFDTPLTFLGQLKTQDARLDLKRGGIFPIVHGIRTLALREGLETRGTLARIEALKRHKVLEARLADDLSESFELFLQLRLTRQLAGQRDGRQQGLDVSGMSRHDRDMLRYGLHVVKKFKQSVARQFHLETR